MERIEIIEALKHMPDTLAAELADVSGEALRRKTDDGWSIIEIAGHLADYAPVQYKRFHMVWSLTDPVLPAYDEKRAAQEGNFQNANPGDLVLQLRDARLKTIELLEHAVDWSRLGNQPGVGRRSLKQFAERAVRHDENHLAQIRALKTCLRRQRAAQPSPRPYCTSSVDIGETLYVKTAAQWRAWLRKHHKTKSEIWFVFYTKASGKPTLQYNDAVEEAMCFGWIDSIVKKLDVDGRAQRFTPRRPKSPLSEMNKERARRLIKSKRMTQAGLDAIVEKLDEPFVVPSDILKALRADKTVWRNFDAFPESYKRIRVGWIDGSRRRQDVFQQRLDYFIKMTKDNKRFGMVQ